MFFLSAQPVTGPDEYGAPPAWIGGPWPGVIFLTGSLALLLWIGLTIPLLLIGLHALRWFARGQRLRSVAWVTAWTTGLMLMTLVFQAQNVPPIPYTGPAILSWGELPVCAGFLLLGGVMVRLLACTRLATRGTTGARG